MQDRFKFKALLKNKTDNLSEPFLKNNVFDVLEIGFSGDEIEIVTLVAYYDNDDYSVYEADAKDVKLIQCTGLKDKNGKLIYEGDILQQPQLPHKVVCEWFKDGFWLNGFMNGAKRELRNMHNWYETIGNIYKNPELLEEKGITK